MSADFPISIDPRLSPWPTTFAHFRPGVLKQGRHLAGVCQCDEHGLEPLVLFPNRTQQLVMVSDAGSSSDDHRPVAGFDVDGLAGRVRSPKQRRHRNTRPAASLARVLRLHEVCAFSIFDNIALEIATFTAMSPTDKPVALRRERTWFAITRSRSGPVAVPSGTSR